jgi:hypothetical protein
MQKFKKAIPSEYEDGVRINRPRYSAAATTTTTVIIIIIIIIHYSPSFVDVLTEQRSGQLQTRQDH